MLKDFSNVVFIFPTEKEDLYFVLIFLYILGQLFIFSALSNQPIFLSLFKKEGVFTVNRNRTQ